MSIVAARAWQRGAEREAKLRLWALLPMVLLVAAGDWYMRRERALARQGEWSAGQVIGSRVSSGARGAVIYAIDFEFTSPSDEVRRGSAWVTRQIYEENGEPGHPLGVLRHPRWPHRCKPVPAFHYVEFLPPHGRAAEHS
jgi:hypothetical protein